MADDDAQMLSAAQIRRLGEFAEALDLTIRLHDREVDAALLEGLRGIGLSDWLGALLPAGPGRAAAAALEHAVQDSPDQDGFDALAAEFADIYLTHGYRVAPNGSVWLTEDHLERQLPMFDVRDWYAHYDISAPDWRVRADDHLVHELQFLSFLCARGDAVAATDAARFMDRHLLPWAPEFCRQAQLRITAPLYLASMALTAALLEALRDALFEISGVARDVRLAAPPKAHRVYEGEDEDARYIPGLAESW